MSRLCTVCYCWKTECVHFPQLACRNCFCLRFEPLTTDGLNCGVRVPHRYGEMCLICLLAETKDDSLGMISAIHQVGVTHGAQNQALPDDRFDTLATFVYIAGVKSGQRKRDCLHYATCWALDRWLLTDLTQLILSYA